MTSKRTASLPVAMLTCLLAGAPWLALASMPLATTPLAAQKAVPAQRVCEGTVEDKAGQPISGAVVYLKDPKSLAIRSYLSDEKGGFHFAQIAPDTDYELWAESNGKQSKTKRIGMFESKNKFEFTLKMEDK